MFMSYPRRGMMMPDQKMLQVMELVGARGGLVMVHAENGYCIDYLTDKVPGRRNGLSRVLPALAAQHPGGGGLLPRRRPMPGSPAAPCTACT